MLIAAIHREWGPAQGNYDEFRFFTGLRPSEQIALRIHDFNAAHGTLRVSKARVAGIDRDTTKTREDRHVVLSPRALAVLQRQLAVRARLDRSGKIQHDHLLFKATGEPIRNLRYPYARWRQTLGRIARIRYRKPYCARHSSVSWQLMSGANLLWVARQHGHSVTTMLRAYAAWTEGAVEADITEIRRAIADRPSAPRRTQPEVDASTSPEPAQASFASEFASRRHRPTAKCVNRLLLNWRRERDSNRIQTCCPISNLRILKTIASPTIP